MAASTLFVPPFYPPMQLNVFILSPEVSSTAECNALGPSKMIALCQYEQ